METSNRRDFLKNAAVAGLSLTTAEVLAGRLSAGEKSDAAQIHYRNLGSTGYKVSEIGFGAMNTRDAELITAAIDAGINYLDTAHGYMNGANEEIIGTIMKTRRKDVFLTTKISWRNPAEMPQMIETSLRRLQTDHVDLLLLHNIQNEEQILNEDFLKVFDEARKKGQTRFVGFSTHTFPGTLLDATLKSSLWEAVLVAYNYLSLAEVTESIRKARETGIAIIGMKSLLKMQSEPPRPSSDSESRLPRGSRPRREPIEDIRTDKTSSTTPQQALLKWVLSNPAVDTIISGMTAFEQLAEDLTVMGMKLSYNDRRIIEQYCEHLTGRYCCGLSGCTGCRNKCPRGVEINELNRCLGYAYGYGDIELARANYRELPVSTRIESCADCTECAVQCVNGLNLTTTIQRARKIFA